MKTVLITNLYLQKYTGSELHTLDVARQFKQIGYDVVIAVFSKTYPLMEELLDFHVVEVTKEKLPVQEYDIIFAQHFPVLDYIITHENISYKYLIISKLSSFNAFESLPAFSDKADLVSVVSKECLETVKSCRRPTFVFVNSATSDFFKNYDESRKYNKIRRIAVISNHAPKELIELQEVMEECQIEYLGTGDNKQLVTVSVLQNYDLIITIGRTVQQCFACGVPVFVYDYFGGPGYITAENISLAETHNFSGRGFHQVEVEELKERIIEGYQENANRLPWLHNIAMERYSFEHNFQTMMDILLAEKKLNFTPLAPYAEPEKTRIKAYTEIFPLTPFLNPEFTGESQMYFNIEQKGLCEENSIKWVYCDGYPITIEKECVSDELFRFDPSNKPCKCKIITLVVDGNDMTEEIVPVNSDMNKDGYHFFLTDDSQYIIKHSIKKSVKLVYQVSNLNKQEMYDIGKLYKEKLSDLNQSAFRRLVMKIRNK